MADSIPSSYKEVYTIDNSDSQKLLTSIFLLGPSKAVISNGKVLVKELNSQQNTDSESSDNDAVSKNSDLDNSSSDKDKSPNESYNYSILEALSSLRYNKIYEADEADNNNSDDNASESPNSDNEDNTAASYSSTIEVIVNLPDEGCTKWNIRLNNVTDRNKIINAIKSKKFRAAYDIANSQAAQSAQDGQSAEGLTVLSATTMLDLKKESLAPFVGRCRWAFDVGSEENNDQSTELEIAIAPIDGGSKKPKENTIYHTVFNIVGDITNGQLDGFSYFNKAKDFIKDVDNSEKENDASEDLHKWLQSRFKCVGDSAMYKEFLAIRKFIEDNINKKTIELNKDESTTIPKYKGIISAAKSFISF